MEKSRYEAVVRDMSIIHKSLHFAPYRNHAAEVSSLSLNLSNDICRGSDLIKSRDLIDHRSFSLSSIISLSTKDGSFETMSTSTRSIVIFQNSLPSPSS